MPLPTTATFTHAATGGMLSEFQVDANTRCGLTNALGRLWFDCNARGFVATPAFDAAHRPVATSIAGRDATGVVTASRTGYGEDFPLDQAQALNLRGQVQQHCAQDGWNAVQGMLLSGFPGAELRYLALDYAGSDDGMPVTEIPPLDSNIPDAGLQSHGYSSALQRIDALGRPIETVNFLGNVLCSAYLLSGLPGTISADGAAYLRDFTHNAKGQILSLAKGAAVDGTSGSLFTSAFRYDPGTWRTTQRYASTDAAFLADLPASGTGWIDGSNDAGRRQDMRYAFDPCGNVAGIQDAWPAVVFNQNTTALSDYGYDALYRLLSANGSESASASPVDGCPGNTVSEAVGFDAGNTLTPYAQYYSYDDGGNVTALQHFSNGVASPDKSTARKISSGSNRSIAADYYCCLGGTGGGTYVDESFFTEQGLFDAGGNQLKNEFLPALTWNYESQTTRIRYPVQDNSSLTVTEYGVHAGGTRSRKVVETRNAQGLLTQLETVDYFGSAEQRASYTQADDAGIAYDGETVGNAVVQSRYRALRIALGHAQQLRILCGVLGSGQEPVTQAWYDLSDQIDSSQLELDADGGLASYQAFYPYGGTAFAAANDTAQSGSLALKVRQYSGEERDGSGVYFYGFRRYQPEAFCWFSPDPSGFAGSGLNWYRMVDGNPVTYRDHNGLVPGESDNDEEKYPEEEENKAGDNRDRLRLMQVKDKLAKRRQALAARIYEKPATKARRIDRMDVSIAPAVRLQPGAVLQERGFTRLQNPRTITSEVPQLRIPGQTRRRARPDNVRVNYLKLDLQRSKGTRHWTRLEWLIYSNWRAGPHLHNFKDPNQNNAIAKLEAAMANAAAQSEEKPPLFSAANYRFSTRTDNFAPTLYFRAPRNNGSGRIRQQHDYGPLVVSDNSNLDVFFEYRRDADRFIAEIKRNPNRIPNLAEVVVDGNVSVNPAEGWHHVDFSLGDRLGARSWHISRGIVDTKTRYNDEQIKRIYLRTIGRRT